MKTGFVIKLIKYYQIVLNVYILGVMLMYVLLGSDFVSNYAYTFIGQSFIINMLILALSFKLKFCFWHQLLIYSQSFCLLLETLNNYGFEIGNYAYIAIIVTMLTLIATWLIFAKHGTFNQKEARKNFKNAD